MIRFGLLILLISTNALAFDWQGHRGARGLYPENTIGAMEEALKYPVTTLELDVVLSKDMQVVVSHEPWMSEEICTDAKGNRVKNRKFNIFKMTYDEIATFDCGSIPHPKFPEQKKISTGKPTLEQLLTITEVTLNKLNRSYIPYNIEIKSDAKDEKEGFQPDVKTFSDRVVKTIKAQLPVTKFTIQSFDWRVLQYIHQTYPDIRLVALTESTIRPEKDLKRLGFKPYVYSPNFSDLDKEHVDFFHKEGIKVIPWTVNKVKDMERIIALDVDGIITDYPDRIEQVTANKCKEGTNYFEGKCIKLPDNSVPSSGNPGWNCKPGFVQKRSRCIELKVPANAQLTPDGKSWQCLGGFKRYRSICKKY